MIHIKKIEHKDKHEVFDYVARHLMKQKRKSFVNVEKETCAYRSFDGITCAVGCLIDDDEYSEDIEGNTWHSLVARGSVSPKHQQLLRRLQILHDTLNVVAWGNSLLNVAYAEDIVVSSELKEILEIG